jgi:hemoglobin/transferrin/lactoferrin receptor protein
MLRAFSAGGIAAAVLLLGIGPPTALSAPRAGRTVTARVLDAITREPLTDVAVIAGPAAATTDAAGRFTLVVANDSTTVMLHRIGYRPVLLAAGALPGEILLQRAPVVLTCLDVTCSCGCDLGVGRGTLLDLKTMRREAVAEHSAPALAEAMETTEGVSTSRPGSWGSKVCLRGLGGERLAVLLDGNRLNRACNVGMDAGLATINPDNVERVEVLAGPGSTLYGSGNVGGVINVVTRGPHADTPLEGEVRLSASSAVPGGRAGGTIWGRRNHAAFTAALDGASYGDQRSPRGTVDGSSFRDATLDLTGSYGLSLAHRMDARLQRYAGRDIGYPGSGAASIPEEDRLLLSLDYGWQASSHVLDGVNAKAYLQTLDHHMKMSMVKPATTPGGAPMRSETDARSNSDTWGGRAQARLTPAPSVGLDAGVEVTQWNAEGTRWVERQRMGTTTLMEFHTWPGVRVADAGAFTQAAISIAPWLDASTGGRLDHVNRRADGFATTTEWVPSGNVGLRVTHGNGLFARAALGFGYRIPDPTELYGLLLRPDGFVYLGEPRLKTETSRNVELSAGWSRTRVRISGTVFRNKITDFISTVVTGDSISGMPVRQYRNVVDARIDGVTGSVSADVLSWLSARGTAGYTRGENRATGAPLPAIPPFEVTAAARVTAGGAWPWIEPEVLGATAQRRAAVAQGEAATPGFAIVNVRAGHSLGRTGLTIGVENLLNAAYRHHLDPTQVLRPGRNAFMKVLQRL